MKKKLIIFIALVVSLIGDAAYTTDGNKLVDEDFKYAMVQVKRMLQVTDYNSGKFPRTTNKEGKLVTTDMYDWTPGFFPGSLWYLYEYSKDATIKSRRWGGRKSWNR